MTHELDRATLTRVSPRAQSQDAASMGIAASSETTGRRVTAASSETAAPDETAARKPVTLPDLADRVARGVPIVMVTAYDAPSARLADDAGVDIILVGDSAGDTVLGYSSTVPVRMEEMLVLTAAAARGRQRALLIADMPFGSFQESDADAVHNAVRLLKEAGADGVKLEGAGEMLARVRALVSAGIPVMGHIGLTPQSATLLGGHRAQGRNAARARQLYDDALGLQAAGCFAIVLEAIPARVATRITRALSIPTIGIGAGRGCDGQVLVWHDLLGLTQGRTARFVRRYADLAGEISRGLAAYAADVRSRSFPDDEHSYGIPDEELAVFEAGLPADPPERGT